MKKIAKAGAAGAQVPVPHAEGVYALKWVKLGRYVEISGDSVDAVAARRKLGKWLDGRECKLVDGRLWINLVAVEQWVEDWPGQ